MFMRCSKNDIALLSLQYVLSVLSLSLLLNYVLCVSLLSGYVLGVLSLYSIFDYVLSVSSLFEYAQVCPH